MVHCIGDVLFAALDLRCRFLRKIEMHVHVVHECCAVHRHFILCELLLVVQRWPIGIVREYINSCFQAPKAIVVIEIRFEDLGWISVKLHSERLRSNLPFLL